MSDIKMLSIDQDGIVTNLDKIGYKRIGVVVKTATSFSEAEAILQSHAIDVIIINYDNNQINTPSLCDHFKTHKDTKDIPIIITSVRPVARELKKKIASGFDLFVEQPIPRQYFIEKIRGMLAQKTRKTSRVAFQDRTIIFNYLDQKLEANLNDISKTGLLLVTKIALEIGSTITMVFSLPGNKKPIEVEGNVVRNITQKCAKNRQSHLGYGIRFENFKADGQKRLEDYIDKTQTDDPKLVYYL